MNAKASCSFKFPIPRISQRIFPADRQTWDYWSFTLPSCFACIQHSCKLYDWPYVSLYEFSRQNFIHSIFLTEICWSVARHTLKFKYDEKWMTQNPCQAIGREFLRIQFWAENIIPSLKVSARRQSAATTQTAMLNLQMHVKKLSRPSRLFWAVSVVTPVTKIDKQCPCFFNWLNPLSKAAIWLRTWFFRKSSCNTIGR